MKEMMEGEMDEDQLIEQRRKERQAIMAKHQQAGGAFPVSFDQLVCFGQPVLSDLFSCHSCSFH